MNENNTLESGSGVQGIDPGLGTGRISGSDRWRGIIAAQRESGLTIADFCRQRSIATNSFHGWRLQLEGAAKPRVPSPGNGFARVRLAPEAHAQTSPGGGNEAPLEIALRGGRRLLVRGGFDRDLLAEVVRVLEGLS